jgi:large subunit ribosomal protein L25
MPIQKVAIRRLATPARWFSSVKVSPNFDPSKLVQGMTKERMDKDPELAEYMKANYPEAFATDGEGATDDDIEINFSELLGRKSDLDDDKFVAYEKKVPIVYPRGIRPLTTYQRDPHRDDGTRNSKRLRYHEGLIPGLLYGGDPFLGIHSHRPESKIFVKTPWNFLQSELDRYHRSFESRVYDLTLLSGPDDDTGGVVHRVTPQNVQRHPVMSTIYCVNFLRYHPNRPLKIPIRFINQEESVALKRDGYIVPMRRYAECLIEDGVDIPESIDVECTGLRVRQVIRLKDLIIPDGVRISKRVLKRADDFVVGIVYGKGQGEEEEEKSKEEKSKEDSKKGSSSGQPAAAAAPKNETDNKATAGATKSDGKAKK